MYVVIVMVMNRGMNVPKGTVSLLSDETAAAADDTYPGAKKNRIAIMAASRTARTANDTRLLICLPVTATPQSAALTAAIIIAKPPVM